MFVVFSLDFPWETLRSCRSENTFITVYIVNSIYCRTTKFLSLYCGKVTHMCTIVNKVTNSFNWLQKPLNSQGTTRFHSTYLVNLYQKFEIEKYTVCGKLILAKKNEKAFLKIIFYGTTGLQIWMDLRIFASFLYPTLLKICTQKFNRK